MRDFTFENMVKFKNNVIYFILDIHLAYNWQNTMRACGSCFYMFNMSMGYIFFEIADTGSFV